MPQVPYWNPVEEVKLQYSTPNPLYSYFGGTTFIAPTKLCWTSKKMFRKTKTPFSMRNFFDFLCFSRYINSIIRVYIFTNGNYFYTQIIRCINSDYSINTINFFTSIYIHKHFQHRKTKAVYSVHNTTYTSTRLTQTNLKISSIPNDASKREDYQQQDHRR